MRDRLLNLGGILLLGSLLFDGWHNRWDHWIQPDAGLGYALGILGGCMVLLMLGYSLRKRRPGCFWLGSTRLWFQLHMTLGVIAPVVILYHANFQLGSTNSRVALFSMLLVAASGLVGRFLYLRIHHGLYGAKLSLSKEYERVTKHLTAASSPICAGNQSAQLLEDFKSLVEPTRLHGHGLFWLLRLRRRMASRELSVVLPGGEAFNRDVRRICRLQLFDRLFSIWHVVHVPFFIMLLLAGSFHVFAVHFY